MRVQLSKIRRLRMGYYQLSPDGTLLVCHSGGAARVYDVFSFEELAVLKGMQYAYQCRFSPDMRMLTIKSNLSRLHRFRMPSYEPMPVISCGWRNEGQDHGFCYSKDGKYLINLASSGLASQMQLYDAESGKLEDIRFEGTPFVLCGIEYLPEKDRYLIVGYERLDDCGANRYFALWYDLENGRYDRVDLREFDLQTLYLRKRKQFFRLERDRVTLRGEDGSLREEIFRCDEFRLRSPSDISRMIIPKRLLDKALACPEKKPGIEEFLKDDVAAGVTVPQITIVHLSVDESENLAFISRSDGLMIHDLRDGISTFLPEFADAFLRAYPVGMNRVIICGAACHLYAITEARALL